MTPLPSADECASVDRLLDELLDASPAERCTRLAALQLAHPQRHALLTELLELAAQPSAELNPDRVDRRDVWQGLVGNCVGDISSPDSRIGAWRIVHHVGRGGMGEVFEVVRDDGSYRQRAALKLLNDPHATRDFLNRFARERQILANLGHPGIARLIDGGDACDGRPYFVMEYVDGVRIDRYCEDHRADLATRLRLFLQVADAVAYAHEQRVIHRDLKPSNIAVDRDGHVKLLDFGIAKVLEHEHTTDEAHTTALFLTPQYSTPEQLRGDAVGDRTDIYQLGLLLFELLTGQRAQEPIDGTPASLLQAVCVEVRPAPSAVAMNGSADSAASVGGLSPRALAAKLRGDLDWIVLMALRQEPQRRYASVRALIEDVRRYLDGLPVRARPETLRYRSARFVQRHRWPVASATVAFVMTIAYAASVTIQANMLAAERDRAHLRAHQAEQTKALVLAMLEGANPEHAHGQELTAKELLDSSWPRIERQTQDQPQVQIEILHTIAEAYRQLGDYDRADRMLTQAREVLARHPSLQSQLDATLSRTLGRLKTDRGEYEAAEQVLQIAYASFERQGPTAKTALAETLRDLGHLAHMRGRDVEAESLYREALAIYRNVPGEHRRAIADGLERLAVALTQQARYSEAAEILQETLALQRQLLPQDHPDIAGNLANLAEVLQRLGRSDAAETLYRESLASMRRSRGIDHPYVATILNKLAGVSMARGDLQQAEQLLQEALHIRRTRLGPRHDLVAMTLNDLGALAERSSDLESADSRYAQALALLPQEHRWRGAILSNSARVCELRGDWRGAESLYRQSLAIKTAQYGHDHDIVAISLQKLGRLLQMQGRRSEASAMLREALRIFRRRLGPEHPRTAEVLALLRNLDVERGREPAASPELSFPPDDRDSAAPRRSVAQQTSAGRR